MSCRMVVAVVVGLGLALPAAAQSPVQPTAPAPAPAVAATERVDEPGVEERRIVAFVATGVAVASLATGITMGVLAQQQFACAQQILTCNASLTDPVVGAELFDLRAEIEQKALFADMAYLFAGAAGVVATVGYLRGFVFVDEPAAPPAAALVVVPPPMALPVATTPSAPSPFGVGALR